MNDLISRSALIEEMKKTEIEYENAMLCPNWWTAFNIISEHPTAYSVDKVVEELEKLKDKGSVTKTERLITKACVDKAIEIVKQGGVSDNICEWKRYPLNWFVGCDGCKVKHKQGNYCPRCGRKIKIKVVE